MRETEKEVGFWTSIRGFIVFSMTIVLLWVSNFWAFPYFFGNPDDVGTAGDMFGAITALFSGLAFAGLISTLLMQRRELELQRRELALSRSEFSLQRFENTLFGLIKIFNDYVLSLETTVSKNDLNLTRPTSTIVATHKGRDALKFSANTLPNSIWEVYVDDPDKPGEALPGMVQMHRTLDEQRKIYVERYEGEYEGNLGPYFRLLYNTMRHIELSNLEDVDKQKYSKIVRAYLSSAEIKLLMFNCSTELGANFKSWVEKYALLKHIHPRDLSLNTEMADSFHNQAFAGRRVTAE